MMSLLVYLDSQWVSNDEAAAPAAPALQPIGLQYFKETAPVKSCEIKFQKVDTTSRHTSHTTGVMNDLCR